MSSSLDERLRRGLDVLAAGVGGVLLAPFALLAAAAVALDSPGPVLFRQRRVGRGGREFEILKFRSMRTDAEAVGGQLTVGADPRVTRVGRLLRKSKFDEIPQLINVLRGDMALVGPRPEVPKYVALYTAEQRGVLAVRPGITDPASIAFRSESELMGSSDDPERLYVEELMPRKLALNLAYLERRTVASDVGVIVKTLLALLTRPSAGADGTAEARVGRSPADPYRVALLATQFPSPAETFVSGRVEALGAQGVEVAVHSLRFEHPRADELASERGVAAVRRTHTTAGGVLRGLWAAVTRPALLARFVAWVCGATYANPRHLVKSLVLIPRSFEVLEDFEREPPDVVHAEWGHYPALILWLVQQRLPEVVTSIGLVAHDLDLELGCTVAATRAADVVRTSTHENVAQVAAFTGVDPSRISVIYDGVDVPAVDAATSRNAKVPGRVAVVARLVETKRVDHVIEAFARGTVSHPKASLHVLGQGPHREELERLVTERGLGERVSFLGHVSHDQVLEELARAEVLALMSVSERLPNVVKEGMAARCVCLATRTNGIEELLEDGVTGHVLEHGDIEGAAKLIDAALSQPSASARLGAAARASVAREFDHRANVERFLNLWRSARDAEEELSVAAPLPAEVA